MPRAAVQHGMLDIESPEGTVSGYLAIPEKGSGPGVLVLHAWWGLNEFFRGFCDQLATAGFVAFAPDLYHGSTASTIDHAEKLMSNLKQEAAHTDIVRSVRGLQVHPKMRGKDLGVIGFSMGAYWALRFADELPADIAAVVVFYGTGDGNHANTQAAVLGHFAESDVYESAASVREFERLLRAGGKDVTIHTYPGTTHWFFEEDRPDAYDADAARVAWERTTQFLTTHLGAKKS
jgi:carboxymethylenebutenolidase